MGYTTKREFRLVEGEQVSLAGHTFTYLGTDRDRTGQKGTIKARVRVERGGANLGVYAPALSIFPNAPGARPSGPRRSAPAWSATSTSRWSPPPIRRAGSPSGCR